MLWIEPDVHICPGILKTRYIPLDTARVLLKSGATFVDLLGDTDVSLDTIYLRIDICPLCGRHLKLADTESLVVLWLLNIPFN